MLQWYLLSSLCVSRCLAKAEALEKTLEQTLQDCGEALDPEDDPDFRGVAGDELEVVVLVAFVVFCCCCCWVSCKLGLEGIAVCDGLTNGDAEEWLMLLLLLALFAVIEWTTDALFCWCTFEEDSFCCSATTTPPAGEIIEEGAAMEELAAADADDEDDDDVHGMEILIVELELDWRWWLPSTLLLLLLLAEVSMLVLSVVLKKSSPPFAFVTLRTASFNWDKCWWMLSGSLRSRVATLTVAEMVGCSDWSVVTECKRIRSLMASSPDLSWPELGPDMPSSRSDSACNFSSRSPSGTGVWSSPPRSKPSKLASCWGYGAVSGSAALDMDTAELLVFDSWAWLPLTLTFVSQHRRRCLAKSSLVSSKEHDIMLLQQSAFVTMALAFKLICWWWLLVAELALTLGGIPWLVIADPT